MQEILILQIGVLLLKATWIQATYQLQLEVEHTIPDFQINAIFAIYITS